MRLISVLYNNFYPINEFFPKTECLLYSEKVSLTPKDILILHGGEDISPSLYKHKPSRYTYATSIPSKRDLIEWEALNQAIKNKSLIFGICRGAQMLCAAAGGSLIQHVNNHTTPHLVHTDNNNSFFVNSIHHQMMNPTKTEHTLLAWTKRSSVYYSQDDHQEPLKKEPECIFFPKIRGLAVQWHPECMNLGEPSMTFLEKELLRVC